MLTQTSISAQSWATAAQAGPSCIRVTRHLSTSTARSARTHGNLSHYDALTLPKNATKQQIKARFYELSKRYHPDAKGGDTSKFHEINDAYAVLGDESKRRTYDLSLAPASQARPKTHVGSHSSFTPNDPYLARNSRGPHQSWRGNHPPPHQHQHRHDNYTPFGRKTPPNFQYEYTYNFNTSPNARRAQDMHRPGGAQARKRDDDTDADEGGGGSIWKFVVTVGLILTVISLGGGLTANAQSHDQWSTMPGDDEQDKRKQEGGAGSVDESSRCLDCLS